MDVEKVKEALLHIQEVLEAAKARPKEIAVDWKECLLSFVKRTLLDEQPCKTCGDTTESKALMYLKELHNHGFISSLQLAEKLGLPYKEVANWYTEPSKREPKCLPCDDTGWVFSKVRCPFCQQLPLESQLTKRGEAIKYLWNVIKKAYPMQKINQELKRILGDDFKEIVK